VLLELTNNRVKAKEWWDNCKVSETPGQLWAWLKQMVVKWIHEKDGTSNAMPKFQSIKE
jgi:hypothetical protein